MVDAWPAVSLSPAELRLLRLGLAAATEREAAATLCCSEPCVRRMKAHICQALGCTQWRMALRVALRAGVEPEIPLHDCAD